MRRISGVFALILLLTACGNSGTQFETNEQSFISGNGIVTTINEDARQSAPLITGPTLDGGTFTATKGRVQVMNVWASWCSPCRAEAPALQDLSQAHPEAQFVGVLTRDTVVAARAFVERFGITYPTITDDALLIEFTGQLSVNAIPTTLLIDKQGRVAARVSGEITYSQMDELLRGLANE